ncbi:MAG: sulfatase-like hydrolase/transferase [Verrucomicrobiota bacterium JB024]|nr:sulfatase-like hydrolase/transferase [Verrucomicrobiota bacterium JB024]
MMKKDIFSAWFAGLGLCTLTAGLMAPAPAAAANTDRPNVLFIYTDDQAAWTVGAYDAYPDTHTPNLNRLASEGALVTSAYASTPVCSPARGTLMTSRYSSETGIHDFIPEPGHRAYTDDLGSMGIDPALVTFPEIMSDNGYFTGLVGKWHAGSWSHDPTRKFHPTNHGYQYFMGLTGGGTQTLNPTLEEDGKVQKFEGLCDDVLTDRAIKFMEKHADDGKPFLLSVHLRSPHGEWLPVADSEWDLYKDREVAIPNEDYPGLMKSFLKKKLPEYLASVAGVDRNVGEMLDALKRLGLDENTIVIFSSDHGYNLGHHGIQGKGNGLWCASQRTQPTPNIPGAFQPNLYLNSLWVPAIVRWPEHIQPGTVVRTPMVDADWYPTVISLTGLKIPEGVTIRGKNMAPYLLREQPDDPDAIIYNEYDMMIYARADMRSIQNGRWKLMVDFLNPWRSELYDLQADPQQERNLMGNNRKELLYAQSEMANLLIETMLEHDDYLLKRTADYENKEKE